MDAIDLAEYLPPDLRDLTNPQTDLPRIARDESPMRQIEAALRDVPTTHRLYQQDARDLHFLKPGSVHLVVTSPPYWTLKTYRRTDGQLGFVADYEEFLTELDKVWQ